MMKLLSVDIDHNGPVPQVRFTVLDSAGKTGSFEYTGHLSTMVSARHSGYLHIDISVSDATSTPPARSATQVKLPLNRPPI